jgi:branched-subunit amino acid ABC-type transport system permease component
MLAYCALITGLGLGSMYGLLALGFYVTYAVSSTVNFAQGSSMMLGAVFAYTLGSRSAGRSSRPPCSRCFCARSTACSSSSRRGAARSCAAARIPG